MPYKDPAAALAARRRWYAKPANTMAKRAKNKRVRVALREWLDGIKAGLQCSRCPENHPACLDFHHEDPAGKDFSMGDAIRKRISKTAILAEIEKCIVLCANCHRKEHSNNVP